MKTLMSRYKIVSVSIGKTNLILYSTETKYLKTSRAVVLNVGSMAAHQGVMKYFLRPTLHL
jgi:hypothetical protein